MLEVRDLYAGYGRVEVLRGVSFTVGRGEIVVLMGPNGAGKTTVLKALAGLLPPWRGSIRLAGREVAGTPAHRLVRSGIALIPEGRLVFPDQTVRDNLRLGAYARGGDDLEADMERHFARFPVLRQRQRQLAGTLSGGEQQMLAIARGLMARPRLLLLDEPSLGLAPRLVRQVFEVLPRLRDEGVTLLLVEQMAQMALDMADRAYVLEGGRIVLEGAGRELLGHPAVARAYLGRRPGPGSAAAHAQAAEDGGSMSPGGGRHGM